MRRRQRKLVGAVAMIIFVCVYALVVMALVQGRLAEAATWVQTIAYATLGLIWIVPLLPLIRWMERPDPDEPPPPVIPR